MLSGCPRGHLPLTNISCCLELLDVGYTITMKQHYCNDSSNQPLEVQFTICLQEFTAHGKGYLDYFEAEIDGRKIKGRIEEKETARDVYDDAMASGQTASLLEQNPEGALVAKLGNLPPGKSCVITLKVSTQAEYNPNNTLLYRIPQAILPPVTTAAGLVHCGGSRTRGMTEHGFLLNGFTVECSYSRLPSRVFQLIECVSHPTVPTDKPDTMHISILEPLTSDILFVVTPQPTTDNASRTWLQVHNDKAIAGLVVLPPNDAFRKGKGVQSIRHRLVTDKQIENICDVCHVGGTDYRCEVGCDVDVCKRCYMTGHKTHQVGAVALAQLKWIPQGARCAACGDPRVSWCCSRGCNYFVCENCRQRGLFTHQHDIHQKEVYFVVDRSGSMSGEIEHVKSALHIFLRSLPQGVTFNIISFGSSYSSLWAEPKPYNDQTLAAATDHVSQMAADFGGTNIKDPLMGIYVGADLKERDVFILTDGQFEAPEGVYNAIRKHTKLGRIFTVGLGDSVSRLQIRKISKLGNGSVEFASQGADNVLATKIQRLLTLSMNPSIHGVSVKWGGLNKNLLQRYPTKSGYPVYSGSCMTYFISLTDDQHYPDGVPLDEALSRLRCHITAQGPPPVLQDVALNITFENSQIVEFDSNPFIAKMAACQTIDVMNDMTDNADGGGEFFTSYFGAPEDTQSEECNAKMKKDIVALALKYHCNHSPNGQGRRLCTDLTSFVAVDEDGNSTPSSTPLRTVKLEADRFYPPPYHHGHPHRHHHQRHLHHFSDTSRPRDYFGAPSRQSTYTAPTSGAFPPALQPQQPPQPQVALSYYEGHASYANSKSQVRHRSRRSRGGYDGSLRPSTCFSMPASGFDIDEVDIISSSITSVVDVVARRQAADGSWNYDPQLYSQLFGEDGGRMLAIARNKVDRLAGNATFLFTLCVVAVLKLKHQHESALWQLFVNKAMLWLNNNNRTANPIDRIVSDLMLAMN